MGKIDRTIRLWGECNESGSAVAVRTFHTNQAGVISVSCFFAMPLVREFGTNSSSSFHNDHMSSEENKASKTRREQG
jgi:hypothetical protein